MTHTQVILDQLRNRYDAPPCFEQLAHAVPELAQHLLRGSSGNYTLDWKNDESVRCLTRALLERDFDLRVELPSDRLCPTVPSRLEYCLWVLKLSLLTMDPRANHNERLIGLDIGTGASCIYPLLLSRLLDRLQAHPGLDHEASLKVERERRVDFLILATEIDQASLRVARNNIAKNDRGDGRVRVVEANEDAEDLIGIELLEQNLPDGEMVDFVMCNPPFYASREEIEVSAQQKDLEPFAVCTAANNELITRGGEVEFVTRMIEESLRIGQSRVRWFTSLIGIYSSLPPLVTKLRHSRITNYHVHLLGNSGQTRRWILSWSLQAERIHPSLLLEPSDNSHNSHPCSNLRKLLPLPPVVRSLTHRVSSIPSNFHYPESFRVLQLVRNQLFSNLGDSVAISTSELTSSDFARTLRISLKAKTNSWSRSARRRLGPCANRVTRIPDPTAAAIPPQASDVISPSSTVDNAVSSLLEVDFLISLISASKDRGEHPSTSEGRADRRDCEEGGVSFLLKGEWRRGLDRRDSGTAWDSLWGVLKRRCKELDLTGQIKCDRAAGVAQSDGEEEQGEARKKRKVEGIGE